MNPEDVFQYVREEGDCWVWTRGRTTGGYGRINVGGYRYSHAHKVAYEQTYGPVPDGMVVMHSCDNPPCIRPRHLRVGTYSENTRDMFAKGRARPGEPRRGSDWLPPQFTHERVHELRAEHAKGDTTYREMAQREGVAIVTIARLVSGRSYCASDCRHPDNVKRSARRAS